MSCEYDQPHIIFTVKLVKYDRELGASLWTCF